MHRRALSLTGWSDAAYGGQAKEGRTQPMGGSDAAYVDLRFLLDFLIGSPPSYLKGPCYLLRWTSKFTR